jgi:hypothetical protein
VACREAAVHAPQSGAAVTTVYITVGNSDDKLSQNEWSAFVSSVRLVLRDEAQVMHGEWFSLPDSPWQNACWCVEFVEYRLDRARMRLGKLAPAFRQDSIAWAEAPTVEFLGASQ